MKYVVIDTSALSEYLRRQKQTNLELVNLVNELADKSLIKILGIVKQEILSGIKTKKQFDQVNKELSHFPLLLANEKDHLTAASFFSICRSKGVQGSHIDFLICAQAVNNKMTILTLDNDFLRYKKHLPVKLLI